METIEPDDYTNRRIVFPPANVCIYCGSLDDLTLEHIVPVGLGGLLELPASSCPQCCDATKLFEQNVLRGSFYNYRLQNIPAKRRKKQRPTSLPGRLSINGEVQMVDIRIEDLTTGTWVMPIYERTPGILTGAMPWRGYRGHLEGWIPHSDAVRSLKLGTKAAGMGMPASVTFPLPFARFLAKVAHGYAFALLGPSGFVPVLTEFIRTGRGRPGHWVASRGGSKDGTQIWLSDPREIYRLKLVELVNHRGVPHIGVTFRAFGYHSMPQYLTVVGAATSDTDAAVIGREDAAWLASSLSEERYKPPADAPPRNIARGFLQSALSVRPDAPWQQG